MDCTFLIISSIVFPAFIFGVNKKYMLLNKSLIVLIISIVLFAFANIVLIKTKNINIFFSLLYNIEACVLALLSLWDIKEKQIPSIIIYILFLISATMMIINPLCPMLNNLISAICFGVFLLITKKILKNRIGSGDIKVIIALCSALGYPQIFNLLFTSMFLTMVFGVILIILKKANLKTEIPFIPFIFLGYIINVLNF